MTELTRRTALVSAVVGGIAVATAAGGVARAEDKLALTTPEQILRDKVEADVRVELAVEGWVQFRGATAGPGESRLMSLKDGRLGEDRLDVLVNQQVFDRLRSLGIEDPLAHFAGKTVVVTGKVHRNPTPLGGTSIIVWVKELSQIESIAKK